MSSFGDRVRQEREARGWSRHELAQRVSKAAGVACPDVTIAKIEDRSSKKSNWSSAIARAFGIDHDWLLSGTGQKIPLASIDKRLRRLKDADAVERLHRQINLLIDDEEKTSSRH